jgi:hypothetical protein
VDRAALQDRASALPSATDRHPVAEANATRKWRLVAKICGRNEDVPLADAQGSEAAATQAPRTLNDHFEYRGCVDGRRCNNPQDLACGGLLLASLITLRREYGCPLF